MFNLDFDVVTKTDRLPLLFDREFDFLPIHLCLGKWSLSESIDRYIQEYKEKASESYSLIRPGKIIEDPQSFANDSAPVISLLLYICSQAEEIGSLDLRPHNPIPQKTKKGTKIFVAGNAKTWNVGQRIGVALRKAYSHLEANEQGQDVLGAVNGPMCAVPIGTDLEWDQEINDEGGKIGQQIIVILFYIGYLLYRLMFLIMMLYQQLFTQ